MRCVLTKTGQRSVIRAVTMTGLRLTQKQLLLLI